MVKLYVIAGHGAGDSGAVGNGYQEAERVRVLAPWPAITYNLTIIVTSFKL